ncbi:ATP-binding protein [Fulvimarina sp. MAC8]|uniref:ATP-binding protein n=1 Tax=Fulvimarina sp. MAC8 TaxID=3162874 RepID=UPI0032EE057C
MDQSSDFFPGDLETVDADLASRMDEQSTRLAARMAAINARYLATKRDVDIEAELKLLIGNASVAMAGYQIERRCLAIIGETGAGKSRSIGRAIAGRPEFLPRVTGMTETAPIVFIKAPRPSNLQVIAYELLEKLQYPLERELKPAAAWRMVRRQLKVRKVRFIHIDEAQHMLNMRDHDAMQELSDALKMVMEDDWPVNLILTGMPELGDFLSIYRQVARRSHKIHLKNLVSSRDGKLISWIVKTIVEQHAEMTFAFEYDDVFLARLCHAANRQLGALTQIVRGAVERALIDNADAKEVTHGHFVRSYEVFSGCQPEENILSARGWESIEPMNALLREQEAAHVRLMQALAERGRDLRGRRRRRKAEVGA